MACSQTVGANLCQRQPVVCEISIKDRIQSQKVVSGVHALLVASITSSLINHRIQSRKVVSRALILYALGSIYNKQSKKSYQKRLVYQRRKLILSGSGVVQNGFSYRWY